MLPEYWQSDPSLWKPSRWIVSPTTSSSISTNLARTSWLEREELYTPPKGTYFPWSDGPQNCPGKRFAQVEFVAVLACLFRNHRVSIVLRPGEEFPEARMRVLATAEDCEQGLLLRMRSADQVRLSWYPV